MPQRKLGRAQQSWILVAVCIVLFAFLILLIPGMTRRIWTWTIVAALVSSGICAALFYLWLRTAIDRRATSINALNRITAGDLSLTANDIRAVTQSASMATALRALVTTLERTIRPFGQLATDVATVSNQISGRARVLARGAAEQLVSTENTSASGKPIEIGRASGRER